MDKTERKQLIDKLEEDESFLSRYRCYSRVDKRRHGSSSVNRPAFLFISESAEGNGYVMQLYGYFR